MNTTTPNGRSPRMSRRCDLQTWLVFENDLPSAFDNDGLGSQACVRWARNSPAFKFVPPRTR